MSAICPRCGETPVVPIVYGLPAGPEVFERAERGEIVLGGCIVEEDDPARMCRACSATFGRREIRIPSWLLGSAPNGSA